MDANTTLDLIRLLRQGKMFHRRAGVINMRHASNSDAPNHGQREGEVLAQCVVNPRASSAAVNRRIPEAGCIVTGCFTPPPPRHWADIPATGPIPAEFPSHNSLFFFFFMARAAKGA